MDCLCFNVNTFGIPMCAQLPVTYSLWEGPEDDWITVETCSPIIISENKCCADGKKLIYLCVATGCAVRGSNAGGSKLFRTCPDRPWGPPGCLYNRYRVSFPGVKWPGRGVDHPLPSTAEDKERVEIYFYSPSGPSWQVVGWNSQVEEHVGLQLVIYSTVKICLFVYWSTSNCISHTAWNDECE